MKEKEKMKRRTRLLSVLLCLVLVFSLVLTSAAMADVPAKGEEGSLGLTSIENARDIGGLTTEDGSTIKEGLLFRTANLHDASDADLATLQGLKVKKVVDLRMSYEKLLKKNKSVPGAEYVELSPMGIPNIAVLQTDDWKNLIGAIRLGVMDTYMANMYRQLVTDPKAIKAYKQFFAELLEMKDGEAFLWHCSAGKDRTGIAAVLIMAALGCDEDTIRDEYLRTTLYYADASQAAYDKAYKYTRMKWIAKEFAAYETVKIEWLETALNIYKRDYANGGNAVDGMRNYLREELDVSDEDIAVLKARYLEPAAGAQDTPTPEASEEEGTTADNVTPIPDVNTAPKTVVEKPAA